ncbi:MAG: MBG domain-containing protein, partial [Imperialibacter sp.]
AYFQIRTISGNSLVQQINWNSSHVAVVNGSQISITGIEPLPANTEFWIKAYSLDNVFVTDAVDNELSPWNNDNEFWRFTTDKLAQTITFPAIADKTFGDAAFPLNAEASSSLAVSYDVIEGNATVLNGVLTITGAGEITVRATQAGDGEYKAAVAVERTFTVSKAAQTISADQISNKTITDIPFAVSATVGSGLPQTIVVSGPATNVGNQVTLTGVTGEVTVTISQTGNANYLAAESVVLTFLVKDPSKTDQTITFVSIADQTYGGAVTLDATASSALAIDYQLVSGPASLNGSELTLTGLGSVTVRATQAGDDDYNPAAQVSRSFEVGKAALTATAENKQMTYDDALPDLTYTVTGFVNSETADVIAGNIEATTEASASSDAGEYAITVSGGTAENYEFSYVDGTLTIGKADQLIAFETLEAKTFGDASFDLVASSDAALPVTFTSSNEAVATISDATVTIVGAGTATITAVQAGSINYNEAETTQELTVSKATQTITFEAIDSQVLSTGSLTLSATASSGLAVSYEVSGPATLEGTKLTFTGAGDITVTASQAGNVNYMAAEALPRTFTVTDDTPVDPVKEDQTITFEAIADKTFGDAAFDLTATASSGLTVSYIVSGAATISGSSVMITGAGGVTITASQAGDDSFNAAADVSQSFTVNKATATITLSDLEQEADGTPKTPTVVTDPSGLEVVFTFDGEAIVPVVAGSYTVVATINDANYKGSAEAVFELIEGVETGVADELSQVLVYPNPFAETINIEGKNLSVIRLHNLNGQLMLERAVTDKTELTTPDLIPGVYLLYLVDGEGRSNIRRMVKK